jgi:hypothetical protein
MMSLPCPLPCRPQHKKHSSEVDEQQLAAAKAFLEQHLQQTDGGGSSAAALAAAAAAGGGGSSKGPGSSKGRVKEKHVGELPADVDPITADDYFERSVEFTAWLQETRHQYFNGENIPVLQLGEERDAASPATTAAVGCRHCGCNHLSTHCTAGGSSCIRG